MVLVLGLGVENWDSGLGLEFGIERSGKGEYNVKKKGGEGTGRADFDRSHRPIDIVDGAGSLGRITHVCVFVLSPRCCVPSCIAICKAEIRIAHRIGAIGFACPT